MEPVVAGLLVTALVVPLLAAGAGWIARGRWAGAQVEVLAHRVADLELEVAVLEAQADGGHAAGELAIAVERKLVEVRARAGSDRAARRVGLLRAGADDGRAAAAPAGGAAGQDGGARAAHGDVA